MCVYIYIYIHMSFGRGEGARRKGRLRVVADLSVRCQTGSAQ